ncbi:MAG TPA: hypothetical protein VI319_13785 [Burkholderiales bacterium]
MPARLHAVIVIEGDPDALAACRARVNALLAGDFDEELRERHTAGRLEYELRVSGGIPFPPFVAASQEFPDLELKVEWSEPSQGRSGRAIIANGALREQASQAGAATGTLLLHAQADAEGRLALALACRAWRGAWHGYAIAAEQHAFFRVDGAKDAFALRASGGVEGRWAERWSAAEEGVRYEEIDEAVADDELRELDAIAREFAAEWIWFAEAPAEETAVERSRYATYGVPVSGANLRSEKLRRVLQAEAGGGSSFSTFGADTRWILQLMHDFWLAAGETEMEPPAL